MVLLAYADRGRLARLLASSPAPGAPGRFLSAAEMTTLRAVTARLIPGPPEDPDPGALEAGCAEAIDLLLAAFSFDPPLIHAGGPFSDRAGGSQDDFAHFVALDPIAELGWRIRLEGTAGHPERAFAGEVKGKQQEYREGLADLDRRARPAAASFASAPAAAQDAILRLADVGDFVSTVLGDTVDVMYGPPEYGGNQGLAGWKGANWPGDVQPRGYTAVQVSDPDVPPGPSLDLAGAKAASDRFFIGIQGVTP
jgi:hypothetical protein